MINNLVLIPSIGLDCLERVPSVLCVLFDSPGIQDIQLQIHRVEKKGVKVQELILVNKHDKLDFIALGAFVMLLLLCHGPPLKEWSLDNGTGNGGDPFMCSCSIVMDMGLN